MPAGRKYTALPIIFPLAYSTPRPVRNTTNGQRFITISERLYQSSM